MLMKYWLTKLTFVLTCPSMTFLSIRYELEDKILLKFLLESIFL